MDNDHQQIFMNNYELN